MAKNKLKTQKISSLLLSLAVPSIVAQLVNVLYNMVDRIYIGQMANATSSLAALSVALPLLTLITAFTQLFGIGGAPICAIRLGEGNKEGADQTMSQSFSMLVAAAIMITLLILIFDRPLLMLFGANKETIGPAMSYMGIYALGTLFVMITLGMNSFITTQGYAFMGMVTVCIGAVLNIILDPIFIFVMGMGVSGAALATIISQAVSCFYVLLFIKKRSAVKIRKEYLKPTKSVALSIISLGISPFVMNATESLLQIAFNNSLSIYGGTIGVAAMAILTSLWQFIMLPLQGLCQGAQPIMSYNYGAHDYQRVRETFKLCFICCVGFGFLAETILLVFAPVFVGFFTHDVKTLGFTVWALRIYLFGAGIFGAQIACQQSFMSLNQPKISLAMAITRKIILLIPLIYILPMLIGHSPLAIALSSSVASLVKDGGKVFAVLLAEPLSDIIAACLTTTMFMRFYHRHLS